jgi:predicted nuclease of predicted toxin-antitoxin system
MGDCIVANALVFRGCASGTSVINTSSILHNASSSICNGSAILPSVNDCMIVFVSHDSDNGASATQTCTNPGVLIERSDNASTLNLDAAVATATRLQTSAANTGSFSCTLSVGPDVNTGTSIALAPHVTVEHSNSLVVCSVP